MNRRRTAVLLCFFPVVMFFTGCAFLNTYQTDGTLSLKGLSRPVTVVRDEKGMAYIRAGSVMDAAMAQGFVTAQDRFFQMALTRLVASGRICELVGESGKALDVRMRTIGIRRIAEKHARLLDEETRAYLQAYADGVNRFLRDCPDELHLEFKLAGIVPEPWSIEDTLAVLYYMSWDTSANLKHEIVVQMLAEKVGIEKARTIFPVNINPEEPAGAAAMSARTLRQTGIDPVADVFLTAWLDAGHMEVGSNNWVVSGKKSATGKPILANDPHLDSRILPGPWYPLGIVLPDIRTVGVSIPGIPGMPAFRNTHVASGVTNAYGDTQDLYIETLDPASPDRYLEGTESFPFDVIDETILIKDDQAPDGFRRETVRIRLTHRGPVISDVLPGLKTDHVLTLRWSAAERMHPRLGFDRLMWARSVPEARAILEDATMIALNFVLADTSGNIGWQVTGSLPIRRNGDGTVPLAVTDGRDDWIGWIPFSDMPGDMNPPKGWLGTCNHKTVRRDYPYYYSSYASPSHRYRRLMQLMAENEKTTCGDHFLFQADTLNLMARRIVPLMLPALARDPALAGMSEILSAWDFHDDADQPGPTVFHAVYGAFARLVFGDELGPDITGYMLDNWYFWEERLEKMVADGTSEWFDDITTADRVETRDDLFRRAAHMVLEDMTPRLGKDPAGWLWGKVHHIDFVNPIRRSGFGKGLLGAVSYPYSGSTETLYRGIYRFSDPFSVTVSASLRMVADLADTQKVLAVLPGGVAGRSFHARFKGQLAAFVSGGKRYWWFSDAAIDAHARSEMILQPAP